MEINDIFTWGKFKGQTLKYVMAHKGSYVGWCLENIKNFHIEPKSLELQFLEGYNKWKNNGYKGLTVTKKSTNLPLGVLDIEKQMVERLSQDLY